MAEFIHEHSTRVKDEDGTAYVVRIYARQRTDGTWEGWLEFHPTDKRKSVLRTEQNRQLLGHRRREKKSGFVPFASFPLSSEQCKDACEYQEKGHHSGDNKQQEFAEEVWFHQLISPHGTTSNLHCRSSLNWPENTIQ